MRDVRGGEENSKLKKLVADLLLKRKLVDAVRGEWEVCQAARHQRADDLYLVHAFRCSAGEPRQANCCLRIATASRMTATICSSEKRPLRIAPFESGAPISQLIDGPKIREQVRLPHNSCHTHNSNSAVPEGGGERSDRGRWNRPNVASLCRREKTSARTFSRACSRVGLR